MHRTDSRRKQQTGFSTLELLVVVAISLVVAGIVMPAAIQTWYGLQMRATAAEVADLMQRTRMQAARTNLNIPVLYQVTGGMQQVYADFNRDGQWQGGGNNPEPLITLPRVQAAAGAPSGGGGQPPAYVDPFDTTAGVPCDNTCTLGFSPRGLPCVYAGPNNCPTPSPSYFVYYFQDGRPNGWSAVLVSKAGRTKTLVWNGTSWN